MTVIAVGALAVAVLNAMRNTVVHSVCGSVPITYPVPGSPWVVIVEEYSCGVSSQWAEVSGSNELTGEQVKLFSFGFFEEFSISFTSDEIALEVSDETTVNEYATSPGPYRVRYVFSKAPARW